MECLEGLSSYIYTTEGGLIAFWRGNTPNILRQAGGASLNFMLMDWYKSCISSILVLPTTGTGTCSSGAPATTNTTTNQTTTNQTTIVLSVPSTGTGTCSSTAPTSTTTTTNQHQTTTTVFSSSLSYQKEKDDEREKRRIHIISAFLSGGLAGGTTTTFLYPMEFMRTRLALDVGRATVTSTTSPATTTTATSTTGSTRIGRIYPRGMRDVFSSIWKTDGIRGLYQGYGIAFAGVFIYRALHLGGYDACKTELIHRRRRQQQRQYNIIISHEEEDDDEELPQSLLEKKNISLLERYLMAQVVSITAGTVCYPIDSVRRR
eukprot:CAMPEP_0171018202 /NCGR_PEP_ID=MMETSP0736-20130129/28106_1 /TAXON_ID=186038 /ORGANISM="Fragilariopsis kerguelensis, Strain L26-C5" /LENGTH=318 /DNA_ID=CAMNT_0011454621 /DNA_START=344 /DNA_END=1296 /DNA_ORIENTATION=+